MTSLRDKRADISGLRLTRVRTTRTNHRKASEIDGLVNRLIQDAETPISAYEISARATMAGTPISPVQVYRTLHRLLFRGDVLRIESLSAYMAKTATTDACLICSDCRNAQCIPASDAVAMLQDRAQSCGFVVAETIMEIVGRCAACMETSRSGDFHGAAS